MLFVVMMARPCEERAVVGELADGGRTLLVGLTIVKALYNSQ